MSEAFPERGDNFDTLGLVVPAIAGAMLELVVRAGRISGRAIAESLEVPPETVHRCGRALEAAGILRPTSVQVWANAPGWKEELVGWRLAPVLEDAVRGVEIGPRIPAP